MLEIGKRIGKGIGEGLNWHLVDMKEYDMNKQNKEMRKAFFLSQMKAIFILLNAANLLQQASQVQKLEYARNVQETCKKYVSIQTIENLVVEN